MTTLFDVPEGCERTLKLVQSGATIVVRGDWTYSLTEANGTTTQGILDEGDTPDTVICCDITGKQLLKCVLTDDEHLILLTPAGKKRDVLTISHKGSQVKLYSTKYMRWECIVHAAKKISEPSILTLSTDDSSSSSTSSSAKATSTSSGTYSSTGGSSITETISNFFDNLIETFSTYVDGICAIFTKDENTSKGEDLKEDEPLTISQAETDGRLFANAAFSETTATSGGSGTGSSSSSSGVTPYLSRTDRMTISSAYDLTQAITRISKEYSKTRADYYSEAQEYNKVRTTRMEYKKAQLTAAMNASKAALTKT